MTTEQRKYVALETGTQILRNSAKSQNKEEKLQRKKKKKKRIADPCHGWKQGRDIIAHRSWCWDLYPDPNFRGHISNHF